MHYWIDGYNLLFRLQHGHPDPDLQHAREWILEELNQKISVSQIEISIVFDATWQKGESSHSHLGALEIFFTGQGETADQYILDQLLHLTNLKQETVVTSDKGLAYQVRNHGAHTQSVEAFMLWLNRLYKNKLQQRRKKPLDSFHPPLSFPLLSKSKETVLEGREKDYLEIFEKRAKKLLEAEKKEKESIQPLLKNKRRQPKPRKDPFEESKKENPHFKTDHERWLEAFERDLE